MAEFEIEPSVQMKLYTLNKRNFACIFIILLTLLLILILTGLTGPQIEEESFYNASSFIFNSSAINLQTGPFHLKTPPLTSFHQQLWMTAKYSVNNIESGKFEIGFHMNVQLLGYADEDNQHQLYKGAVSNNTNVLVCSSVICEDINVLHLAYLINPYYIVNIQTSGLESLQFKINNIQFKFTTYNTSFSKLQIWFRFTFLVLSFLVTCLFAYSLRKFSFLNWSMEQRWMMLMLPFLLLYNDPIFALGFLVPHWVPGTIDIFFQATFLAALLLFWLCTYHGVRQVKRKCSTFYLPKLILVMSLWFNVIILASWQRFKDLNDPSVGGNNLNLKIFIGVLLSLYFLYLIYLIIRAYAELKSMPYFDLRLKFNTSLLFFFIILTVIVIALRHKYNIFGIGFFSAFSSYPISTLEFVVLYGLVNILIVAMAFVYSPSSNAFYESHFKDNPALSMLNESEDEIIYGEEISLTAKANKNKYDSDEEAFN